MVGGGLIVAALTFSTLLFLHEKRALEVPDFVTLPNSLMNFQQIIVIFVYLEGADTINPPHKQHPEATTIRGKESILSNLSVKNKTWELGKG